jgi:arylsulfatase A-like enzyme
MHSWKILGLINTLVFSVLSLKATDERPPNILFVIADQWRAQAFGFAGDPNVQTPHLDQFEKQCVNFTQAVSGCPVCSPTRASLLTGQRPLTHGIFLNDVPLNPEAVTFAKVLQRAGYDTGCIGKWHIDGHGRTAFIPRERRQGFDYWKVLECTHAYNKSPYYADGPEKLEWPGYDALAQTRDAQAYLTAHAHNAKPFLLWLSWGPPHNPYETAPKTYRDLYQASKFQLRGNVPDDATSQRTTRADLLGYYAHCSALDACFADLLATLKATGLDDNTIVVFTSDHGDMLGSHHLQRKQKPYEESARIPFLLRLPSRLGITPQRLDGTLNSEDVMPTLLSLCHVPIPKTVEGLDFSGYLHGAPDPSEGSALIQCVAPFGEYTRQVGGREYRCLRTSQYTYARDLNGPWLLFDNLKDPFQLNNLVGQPAYAELQTTLDKKLQAKLTAQHDEFLPAANYIAKWKYIVDATGTAPIK